ncbi:MAG: acetyl-CoA C-acyltransferase [Dehalococcoidia bacterium]|nr:acetyl-CoA C-acyltransferase [Dehalococcoidia bacterium]
MDDRDVVIVEAVRTPIGRRNGSLAGWHPVDLVAHTLKEVVNRAGVDSSVVQDVVMGCVMQRGEQALNIGRNAVLAAGFPYTIPGTTVDRQCGSAQQAIHFAANLIQADVVDCAIGGGVEVMTRHPLMSNMTEGGVPYTEAMTDQYDLTDQGTAADNIARTWNITREQVDQYGYESHMKASRAREDGNFDAETVPVEFEKEGVKGVLTRDEGPRPDTTVEKLATLQPAFGGVHTAGNSSQISDGAAAVLLMSAKKAKDLGLRARARIVAQAVVGSDPELMLTGPITATPAVLDRAGLKLSDMDLIEINEAFASVVLAWQKELDPDMSKVNVNGGAIGLGHPVGMTGARLMATLLHSLERTGGRYGHEVMCCGGGIGTATIIERLD